MSSSLVTKTDPTGLTGKSWAHTSVNKAGETKCGEHAKVVASARQIQVGPGIEEKDGSGIKFMLDWKVKNPKRGKSSVREGVKKDGTGEDTLKKPGEKAGKQI